MYLSCPATTIDFRAICKLSNFCIFVQRMKLLLWWWWWSRRENRNVVVVLKDEKQ